MKLLHLITVLLVGFLCGTAASNCPPRIKVQNRSPTCRDNYDCRKYYKICCPNAYNALSCTYPAPFARLRDIDYKSNQHQVNSIRPSCNGLRCMPYEECRLDRRTGKPKCQLL